MERPLGFFFFFFRPSAYLEVDVEVTRDGTKGRTVNVPFVVIIRAAEPSCP